MSDLLPLNLPQPLLCICSLQQTDCKAFLCQEIHEQLLSIIWLKHPNFETLQVYYRLVLELDRLGLGWRDIVQACKVLMMVLIFFWKDSLPHFSTSFILF